MPAEPSRGDDPFPLDSPWTGEARSLLERAIRRHGGWSTWRSLGGIALRLKRLGGLLPVTKGLDRTFPSPRWIEVWPREAVAVFHDYPAAGGEGVYAGGEVRLLDAHGAVVAGSSDPRASFSGMHKYRRWSPLDALYFFGYAIAHYHALPFTLVDGRPLAMTTARSGGGHPLRGVRVELPPSVHTHCRTQTFFFDEEGLLRRHDYTAEIVGSWARGAHLWDDFALVGELPVARRRRVVARLGSRPLPVVVLSAEIDELAASAVRCASTLLRPSRR